MMYSTVEIRARVDIISRVTLKSSLFFISENYCWQYGNGLPVHEVLHISMH